MLLENSHFRPRGVLEWRKAGIELSTSSDEAAKLLDCLFYQLYSFSSDVSLGGLKGTMLRMRNADPDFILPQLFQYKLRIKGPSIHHEPFKVGLKDFKSALAQQTACRFHSTFISRIFSPLSRLALVSC
ncbi:unnamed protein product [Protopolystoma xenopodis]|uniref:Uncharacterized protein n=1 Tax=Protopolystoma xenopodis TaxID=117903 RepID=A0A3S5BBF8_9PLAT|nr:unnamed protein product [Protopolystoma xenopodis]